ncbi:MAG: hypothetical protein MZW92_30225 [Comamonadaceae bacterium]|nr:hypothetical protein [Comamonadaceae bacterium]
MGRQGVQPPTWATDRSAWAGARRQRADATRRAAAAASILVDQGAGRQVPRRAVAPRAASRPPARAAGQPLTLRRHAGYDHGYYFVAELHRRAPARITRRSWTRPPPARPRRRGTRSGRGRRSRVPPHGASSRSFPSTDRSSGLAQPAPTSRTCASPCGPPRRGITGSRATSGAPRRACVTGAEVASAARREWKSGRAGAGPRRVVTFRHATRVRPRRVHGNAG